MNDHDGDYKGFVHTGEAWYANSALGGDTVDSMSIGWYCPDGGTSGEFIVDWVKLGGGVTPVLRIYDDGWDCFKSMPELFAALAELDSQNPSAKEVAALLVSLGFHDRTERKHPYKPSKEQLIQSAKAKLTPSEWEALTG